MKLVMEQVAFIVIACVTVFSGGCGFNPQDGSFQPSPPPSSEFEQLRNQFDAVSIIQVDLQSGNAYGYVRLPGFGRLVWVSSGQEVTDTVYGPNHYVVERLLCDKMRPGVRKLR